MSGKDAIVEKILADARQKANSTLEEAIVYGKQITAEAENDARIFLDKNMTESYQEREEIIRRRITVANLEVKKQILAKKQEILKRAFDGAVKAIKKDSYVDLLYAMLEYAEDGDEVYFSAADKDIFDKEWFSRYLKKSGKKLVFGGYGDFSGGIIISGKDNDKNLSLEVELKAVRERYEAEIAALIFGE